MDLIGEFVTGTARAPSAHQRVACLRRQVLCERVAALDHEILDHAVEFGAVINPSFANFTKFATVLGASFSINSNPISPYDVFNVIIIAGVYQKPVWIDAGTVSLYCHARTLSTWRNT